MKHILQRSVDSEFVQKNKLAWVWQNQHPVMCWWFGLTSLSLCSIYILLFTKFTF